VQRGMIPTLLAEISHALVVANLEDVPLLRLELYQGNMQLAGGDLQGWINFVLERQNKLSFLGQALDEAQLTEIFLKGLNSTVFRPLKVHFAVPGHKPRTLDEAIAVVRSFAADPSVAVELTKLKSTGLSQAFFQARSGQCRYGIKCKFAHTPTPKLTKIAVPPARGAKQCEFCNRFGHSESGCQLKEKLLKQLQTKPQVALSSASAPASPLHTPVVDMTQFAALAEATEDNAFTFVLSATAFNSRRRLGT